MNNNYLWGIVVIVILVGAGFLLMNKKTEAPTIESENITSDQNGSVDMSNDTVDNTDNNSGVSVDVGANLGAVKAFTVTGSNFSFSPSTIKVKKGDKVKITFKNSEGFHDFVIDEYGVATKQLRSPGEEVIEFTATKTGSFEYYCSVGTHRSMGMKGTLVVE